MDNTENKEVLGDNSRAVKSNLGRNIILLVILVIIVWFVASILKSENMKTPGVFYKSQGAEHILVGQEHDAYDSNPPSSGWHYDRPAQTGIYDRELPDETLVHNLEHQHIWIAYSPDLSSDQVEMLASLANDYGSKVVMTPRSKNDSPIALVAWEYVLKLDSFDEAQIRGFIDFHRSRTGPEKNIPDSGFGDFRSSKK